MALSKGFYVYQQKKHEYIYTRLAKQRKERLLMP